MDIYVVRKNSLGELCDSSPCVDCYETLKKYNIRNLVYSNEEGKIKKIRLKNYEPKTISLGRRFINNGYKMIKKPKMSCIIQ
jgi:hypothetical protein